MNAMWKVDYTDIRVNQNNHEVVDDHSFLVTDVEFNNQQIILIKYGIEVKRVNANNLRSLRIVPNLAYLVTDVEFNRRMK